MLSSFMYVLLMFTWTALTIFIAHLENFVYTLSLPLLAVSTGKALTMWSCELFSYPGEMLVSEAERVLQYTPYGDHKQGVSGTLCCTNFKVTFIAPDRPAGQVRCTSMLCGCGLLWGRVNMIISAVNRLCELLSMALSAYQRRTDGAKITLQFLKDCNNLDVTVHIS